MSGVVSLKDASHYLHYEMDDVLKEDLCALSYEPKASCVKYETKMGTRNSGKKSDGVPAADSPPPRLLRPRGICFRCHFPSCVCPSPAIPEVKIRTSSALVSPETSKANSTPTILRKRKPEPAEAVRPKSKSPSSRRQLFRENFAPIGGSDFDIGSPISSVVQASSEEADTSSESSDSDHSCESSSSQVVKGEDSAIPSTSIEPVPSTSAEEMQSLKLKRRKRKLKTLGRHVCPVCSKIFGSPGKLNQHMFSHTGEKPFECDKCLKAFSSKFKLVRHLLIHSDERQYRCPMCDRTFHRKDHLKNHLKVHSPVKKTYRCDKVGCVKVYSSLLSYRKHAAVHAAEEGDLECKMCGKNFSTKDEIVYHLKVHAGSRTVKNPSDKKYGCDYCDRRFFTRKDVRRHLVVHTGKRDFLCQFCPHRFGRKDHLVRHIKKSHSNVSPGIKSGASKAKRPRQVSSLDPSQVNASSTSGVRQRTVLRIHGRPKATATSELPSETNNLVFEEPVTSQYIPMAGVSTDEKSTKQETQNILLKSEVILTSHNDSSSYDLEHVKVEDCRLLPDLQPMIFSSSSTHSPFGDPLSVDSLTVPTDRVDGTIKSEEHLESLQVGMDMNQFMSGYLVPSSVTPSDSNEEPVPEPSVCAQPPPSAGISEAEASEFLAHFPNHEEIMQLMEFSIPITSASTSSPSSADLSTSVALPRFQQAFQQQPP